MATQVPAMEHVPVDETADDGRTADRQGYLSDPLGLSDMAMNYFELEPGDSLSGGLHTHMDQEEVFYVIEGTATFETLEGSVEVDSEEVVRFAPGEYQEGKNESDERVRVLAMGAPQDDGEVRVPMSCRECDADYHVTEVTDEGILLTCPDCGNEIRP